VAPEIRQDFEQEKSFGVGDSPLDPINEDKEERGNKLLDAAGLEKDEVASLNTAVACEWTRKTSRVGLVECETKRWLEDQEISINSKFALKDLDQDGMKLKEDKSTPAAVRHQ
jgi:hypothetical protein